MYTERLDKDKVFIIFFYYLILIAFPIIDSDILFWHSDNYFTWLFSSTYVLIMASATMKNLISIPHRFIYQIYKKFKIKKYLKTGLGPMSSKMLNCFLDNRCMKCFNKIPDSTLFENGLVVKKNKIKIECFQCRSNNSITLKKFEHSYSIDKIGILYDLTIRIKDKNDIDWHHIVLCWRENNGLFLELKPKYTKVYENIFYATTYIDRLSGAHKPEIFGDPIFDYKREPIQRKFGNKFGLGSCGECGNGLTSNGELINQNCCEVCRLPYNYQWNMRIKFKDELNLLK
jgi:hypothetical protein